MLDKGVFLEQLAKLDNKYNNFNFDLTNQAKVEAWYEDLCVFDDDTFNALVKSYSVNESYPPTSPASLLNHYRGVMLESVASDDNVNEAFKTAYSYVRQKDWKAKYAIPQLKRDGLHNIAKAVETTEQQWINYYHDETQGIFIKKDFANAYINAVKEEVNSKLNLNVASNQLIESANKLIEKTEQLKLGVKNEKV